MSVDQLAEQLGCVPDDAIALVRRVGPRGIVRTADRRFLIPAEAVEQLRTASSPRQQALELLNVVRWRPRRQLRRDPGTSSLFG